MIGSSGGASVASLAAALTGQYHPPPSRSTSRQHGRAQFLFAQDAGWLSMAPATVLATGGRVRVLRLRAREDGDGDGDDVGIGGGPSLAHGWQDTMCLGSPVVRHMAAALGQTDVAALNGLVEAFRGSGFARHISDEEAAFWAAH